MEPQWSKKISSTTVCNTYYFIFVLYAIVALVAVVGTIVVLVGVKMPKSLALAYGFQGALTAVLASILMLFQYLVCSRALLGSGKKEGVLD
jgi:CBS domain containing-hemolysin-like protein